MGAGGGEKSSVHDLEARLEARASRPSRHGEESSLTPNLCLIPAAGCQVRVVGVEGACKAQRGSQRNKNKTRMEPPGWPALRSDECI